MRIDLHVHSAYSKDCSMRLEEIVRRARAKGLDGVAIADHGTAKGALKARRLSSQDFVVIAGAEIKTDRGEVLGYFLQEEIRSREFFEVVEEIRAQGGMVSVPHPFDPFRIYRLRGLEELHTYVDAVEVFNARCAMQGSNRKALRFALEHGLKLTAGSDAHTYAEIGGAGVVVESVEDIRKGRVEIFGTPASFLELLKTKIYKTLGRRG
jgi:hypothetical protein